MQIILGAMAVITHPLKSEMSKQNEKSWNIFSEKSRFRHNFVL